MKPLMSKRFTYIAYLDMFPERIVYSRYVTVKMLVMTEDCSSQSEGRRSLFHRAACRECR